MPRLREVSRRDTNSKVVVQAYDLLFGPDRDPVANPGTETGTPGNWWTVFALVPDALDHALLRGFRFYQSPDRKLNPVFRELGQTRAGWLVGSQFVFSLDYERHLFYEKELRRVTANTRLDGEEFMKIAGEIPIRTHTAAFGLGEANVALNMLKHDQLKGAAVLRIE